ncbi:hypothetical protein pdam_00024105 [Pocillopora damicornis]|uniref:Uncharacterized protein n=1 Tax=Pocillopora damicornis TaxID=46731 RepID=A0A3M6V2S3_POCDA|nr:hypothetical protein pdam_00024105 [Pocillopora damicornis]
MSICAQFAEVHAELTELYRELDFQCPTCKHTVKLHPLPQHQEYCIPSPTTASTLILAPLQRSVSIKPSPLVPVKPIPAAEEKDISTSRTYNHHWHNNNLWGTTSQDEASILLKTDGQEIDKFLGNATEEEDNIIKLCSAVVTKTEELCPSFLPFSSKRN